VLIVGAGISGVTAAWDLQDRCPDTSYAILEARPDMSGTWDLFRYPGIRSDSDTFQSRLPEDSRPEDPHDLLRGRSPPSGRLQGRDRCPQPQ
jgi:cation diffusion facilitator CzcD-associated flavoprotein CzcO